MGKTRHPGLTIHALLLCLLLITAALGCQGKSLAEDAVNLQARNLQKLCKVWGYVKYTHPVFLSGKMDWDAELLELIGPISGAGSEEAANDILYNWFIGLGEIEYGTDFYDLNWVNASDDQRMFLAETGWLADTAYLGQHLSSALSQLGDIPTVYRGKAPVHFGDAGNSAFTNEKTYEDMDYADSRYRLLGLFRLWNVIEYYYPYRDILDDDWNGVLKALIPKMLEGEDKHSYQLALAQLVAKLHDAHAHFADSDFLFDEFGWYAAPVSLIRAEGQLVVRNVYKECTLLMTGEVLSELECALLPGDVLLKLNGRDIGDIVADCKQYVSVTTDEKLMNALSLFLLRSHEPEMVFTVLRQGVEMTVMVQGVVSAFHSFLMPTQSHVLLKDNIGLINPSMVTLGEVAQIMDTFADTRGLIVDLRQYPYHTLVDTLAEYLVDGEKPFCLFQIPSKVVPGAYIRSMTSYSGNGSKAIYDKPVVILMDELTQSSGEFTIMSLRNGANVTVMGRNSVGSDADVTTLPLPDGNVMSFTGLGAFTPEGGQTQRIGLSPDIYVEPTIAGIREGRDEFIEAAIAYILDRK